MSLVDRVSTWFTPQPPSGEPDWTPPELTAAAQTPGRTPQSARATPQQQHWQDRAWYYYHQSGPARQAVDWLAGGISRMRLFIGANDEDTVGDPQPADDAPADAVAVLEQLSSEQSSLRDLLHKLTVGLCVPGEAWLIGYPAPPPPGAARTTTSWGTAWAACSRAEWATDQPQNNTVRVKIPRHPDLGTDGFVTFNADDVVIVPVYQPDPQDATKSTSRFEAAMHDLDELDGLCRRVAADIRSRLVGAGIVALPESASIPDPGMSEADGANPMHGDPLVRGLMDAASRAIQEPDSPNALVPIITHLPDDAIAKMQHLEFYSQFDSQVPVLREHAKKAVAAALDVPATVVTGIEELNHWTVWQIEDSAVRSHLGPLISLICATINREILWPTLRAAGHTNPHQWLIWWDPTEITLRPDRSTEALQAFKEGIISGEAARRELGFGEDDAPTGDEPAVRNTPTGETDPDQRALRMREPANDGGGQAAPSQRPDPPQPDSPG